jgi:16S rRNA (uracil1498-N3)-methyltransferase
VPNAERFGRQVGFAANASATAHVLVAEVHGEGDLTVDGPDGHHLQRVRRLRAGEAVTAADGAGTWRRYEVRSATEGRVVLAPAGPVTEEPELLPRVTVAFAPAKGEQAGPVVHQLVELGVDRVVPVSLERSVVRWDDARAEKAVAKLERVAREAAMQCRRSRLPEIGPAAGLDAVTAHPGLLVADPTGVPAPALPAPPPEGWLVLVGPEGGLSPGELARVGSAVRLAVGPYVLRAVTAPVAAAAALVGLRSANRTTSPDSSGARNST